MFVYIVVEPLASPRMTLLETDAMRVSSTVDNVAYDYTVVVKGDANGDGLIYATDYVKIKNQIMGRPTLQGAYYLAADIDNDGNCRLCI